MLTHGRGFETQTKPLSSKDFLARATPRASFIACKVHAARAAHRSCLLSDEATPDIYVLGAVVTNYQPEDSWPIFDLLAATKGVADHVGHRQRAYGLAFLRFMRHFLPLRSAVPRVAISGNVVVNAAASAGSS